MPGPRVQTADAAQGCLQRKEITVDLALQGAMWMGAGVTLVMLLSRRRKRMAIR
jgi:hypothetical protein